MYCTAATNRAQTPTGSSFHLAVACPLIYNRIIMPVRARLTLPLLIAALALAARLIPGPRTIDDACITFRYARNLLSGSGFVYNPGEHVQGTTTPLYTLWMAGLGALTGGPSAPFPALALATNALADVLTCLLLVRLGERAGSRRAGLAAGFAWSLAPFSVTFAIGGLETSVYVLLLTGAILAHLERRRTLAALLGVLALLTRPDAILLVGPLILDRLYRAWRRHERLGVAEMAAFLLPAAAWGLFATLYFGSPIPHSVQAKLQVYRLDPASSLMRLMQHYATPFLEQNLVGTSAAVLVGLVLYPFLYIVGARRGWRAQPRLWMWWLYPWVYLAVFALPNPLIFRWYLTPPLPAYFLGIFLGLEPLLAALAGWLLRRSSRSAGQTPPLSSVSTEGKRLIGYTNSAVKKQAFFILGLMAVLPLAGALGEWRIHPTHGADRPAPEMAYIELELLYRQAAEWLAPSLGPESVLAAGDVGVLGYYSPARILDTVGLNSPRSLQYYPLPAEAYEINYAVPARLVLAEQPDWIVILEVYGRRTLLRNAEFARAYTLRATLPTNIYGSRGMLIFERVGRNP